MAQYDGVYSYARMWELVDVQLNWDFPSWLARYKAAFSDDLICGELLMAIFWEETFFSNVGQQPVGPAIGFGQVEDRTRKNILHYFNNETLDGKKLGEPRVPGGLDKAEWTKQKVLDDPHKSVMLPVLGLCKIWEEKTKSLMGMLRIYGGYDEVPTTAPGFLKPWVEAAGGNIKVAWHNQRQAIIDGWLACRDKLRLTPLRRKPEVLGQRTDEALQVIRRVIHALNLSKRFCNLCYDAFDPDAKPPLGPPNFVLPLILKVFPNVTVKFAPKSLGKWAPDGPRVVFP